MKKIDTVYCILVDFSTNKKSDKFKKDETQMICTHCKVNNTLYGDTICERCTNDLFGKKGTHQNLRPKVARQRRA